MKDHSQRSDSSVIDVPYALSDGNLLSRKLEKPMFDIHFAGHIPGGTRELVSYLVISFSLILKSLLRFITGLKIT